jgi:hypothetical protein
VCRARVRHLAASRQELLDNAEYYVTRTLDRSFPASWQRRVDKLAAEIAEQFPAAATPEEAAAELGPPEDPPAPRMLVRVERVALQPPQETAVAVPPVPLFAFRLAPKLAVQREGMMVD